MKEHSISCVSFSLVICLIVGNVVNHSRAINPVEGNRAAIILALNGVNSPLEVVVQFSEPFFHFRCWASEAVRGELELKSGLIDEPVDRIEAIT